MRTTWAATSVVIGVALVLLTLLDVFFTVLSPGSGRGPVRRPLARAVQAAFGLSRHLGSERRRRVLTYLGPVEVTATLVGWFVLLVLGWAAIYHSTLGSGIVAAGGPTRASWGTALYFSGYDLTTLGLGDIVATTAAWRMLVVAEAATGFMTFTLAISYFVSVYGTLTARNAFAMALHDRSGGTGQGSQIVRALWEEGPVAAAMHLTDMAEGVRVLAQTHHSYPVLRSFHYNRDYYALPRILLTCWETVALLETTVESSDVGRPELTASAVAEMRAAATRVTAQLHRGRPQPRPEEIRAWRAHHAEMVEDLRRAGVRLRADSASEYLASRGEWDASLAALSARLLYEWPDHVRLAPGSVGTAAEHPAAASGAIRRSGRLRRRPSGRARRRRGRRG